MDSVYGNGVLPRWVSPFRNLRIKDHLHLPAAYHVFLRLLVPRHSPCALLSLTVLPWGFGISPASPSDSPFANEFKNKIVVLLLNSFRSLLFSFQGALLRTKLPSALPFLFLSFQIKKVVGSRLESLNTFVAYTSYKRAPCLFVLRTPLVGSSGLEPPTSRLSGARSNHLSYEPILVEIRRLELLTPCLQSRCSPS